MQITSLKRRLCLAFIPLLVVIVAVVAWIAHWEMEEVLYSHVDRIVRAKCRGITSIFAAVSDGDEQERLINEFIGHEGDENTAFYWLWDPGEQGVLMTNAAEKGEALPWMPTRSTDTRLPEEQSAPCCREINGIEHRVVQCPIAVGNQVHWLFLAFPSQSLHDQLHQFLWFLFGLGTLIVVVAIGLVIGAVYWALRPVNRAADLLKSIAWSDPRIEDIDGLNVPSELTAFKKTLTDMLSRLDQFVDKQKQFTANAAHELRTPLTLAKSTVQTAFYQLKDSDCCEQAMTEILGDLDRMAGLIDQLQMLSRLDETDGLEDVTTLSLESMLEDIIRTYQQNLPDRVLGRGLRAVLVQGNEELLHCLFSNLIDNALKYGPPDRPVSIQMQPELTGGQVCVEITDEGGGIDKEDVARLMERFYRVDSSRTRDTGGSGLGLAIAQEITRKHGGQLAIESDPATGTCVRVQLPTCKTNP